MGLPQTAAPTGVHVVWCPQDGSQVAFMSCPFFEVLYHGTRGPGKTDALLMDFGQFVGRGFGAAWRGILFRETHPQLADVITKSKKWFKLIWPGAQFNEASFTWKWPTGEELLLRHFKKEDDYWNYHGHEYPWIGWEELCNWSTLGGYKRMMSCCRSSTPGLPRHYRATTNPYGPGHNLVKHRFQLPGMDGVPILDSLDDDGQPEPARIAIFGSIKENKRLLAADPEYINRIRAAARNEAERKAWLDGSWDIVAGGMFDDVWDPSVHVIKPFEIPHSWKIDRSFDWGSSKPFSVGWWAESDGSDVTLSNGKVMSTVRGDLFRIREWYGWNGRPNEGLRWDAKQISKGIIERELLWKLRGRVSPGPADSSIYDVENGSCIATDMQQPVRLDKGTVENGITWTRADKSAGSRKTGWLQVRAVLRASLNQDDAGKPRKKPREQPGMFVFTHCDQFQRTVPVLPREQKDPDDVDTDAEDHTGDEVRYRVRFIGQKMRQGRTVGGT